MLLGAFPPPKPENRIFCGTQFLASQSKTKTEADPTSAGYVAGETPSSMVRISIAEVLRLRATGAVLRKKSVRRSAQDDESVTILKKNILNKHRSHADTN
jgi:hypothetical protein